MFLNENNLRLKDEPFNMPIKLIHDEDNLDIKENITQLSESKKYVYVKANITNASDKTLINTEQTIRMTVEEYEKRFGQSVDIVVAEDTQKEIEVDIEEISRLVMKLDLTNIIISNRFTSWKNNDGSVLGLQDILDLQDIIS